MATFVEVRTDAFADNVRMLEVPGARTKTDIRRPYRGIEIKEDTYAVMKVLKADGTEIPLVDAGGSVKPTASAGATAGSTIAGPNNTRQSMASTYNYSNFIVQRVNDVRQEKTQILETFGDPYIFFFGERPRVLAVTGLLMNTLDFNWRSEFWYNYEHYLRGTRLVEQNARIYLYYDDLLVEGYMIQAQAQDDSEMPYHIPFSFQLFVTNHTYLSQIGDEDYPVNQPVNIQPLLHSSDVVNATYLLKQKGIQGKKYESNVDTVRKALQRSAKAQTAQYNASVSGKLENFQKSKVGQALNASKNLLAGALTIGLQANNLTFLSLAAHFFAQRKVLFPRGLAGAEAYAGRATYANKVNEWGFRATRGAKPIRSKIRDNVDEYTKSNSINYSGNVAWDQDAVYKDMMKKRFQTPYALEAQALKDISACGVRPIQHPGGGKFDPNGIRALGGDLNKTSALKFGQGDSLLGL